MKPLFCLFFTITVLLVSHVLHSQVQVQFEQLQQNHRMVEKLFVPQRDSASFLRTPYASGSFTEIDKIRRNAAHIRKIILVYTTYKYSPAFDQEKLNYRRLLSLYKMAPELFDHTDIEWEMAGQTGCNSREEGNDFFHGFVIIPAGSVPLPDPEGYQDETVHKREVEFMDSIIRKMTRDTLADTILYFTKSKWDDRLGFVPDSNYAVWSKSGRKEIFRLPHRDSTVLTALNKIPVRGRTLIVADVTGSMSTFNTQLLVWLRRQLTTGTIGKVVFFNDGDKKPDFQKIPGSTGGIYIADPATFDDITSLLQKAMKNGNGGDIPENNVEAILEGLKHCPDCSSVIMIADNLAPVRDLELAKNITVPVHVILCGKGVVALQDYQTLAATTNGSVTGKPVIP